MEQKRPRVQKVNNLSFKTIIIIVQLYVTDETESRFL